MLLGVDVGGTFTDAVLYDGRAVHTAKSPTTPDDQSRGVIAAIDAVLGRARAAADDVDVFAHGMTVGTNALLEEGGARTALVATEGFADLLEIGRQNRPSLYHLCRPKPTPLAPPELRFGIPERVGRDGVIDRLDAEALDATVERLRAGEVEAVAVCLLFSFLEPAHEAAVAACVRDTLPGVHVSASHEVLPQFREFERCSTTVIDAYLSPLLDRYLGRLSGTAAERGLPEPLVMQSSGGVAPAAEASRAGAWSVLSGPAGGAVGAGLLAGASGDGNALGIDMGGTSCDVCVVEDGRVRRTDWREIDGRVLQLPMVDVHTVGAGGGSVGWRDGGGALRVGPRSAGAEPGPACYGRGGTEPAVTDANLLLGYLAEDSTLAGGVALDVDAARDAVRRLGGELGLDELTTAEGIVRVANQEMIRALRVVTVERGIDPREFALMPFGGAGPMHAAALANELDIRRILCPRASGVLSALGLIASDRRRDTARTVMLSGDELTTDRIAHELDRLRASLGESLEGAREEATFELRYRGQAFELPVPGPLRPDPAELAESFASEHERRYGYRDPDADVELVTVRLATIVPGPGPRPEAAPAGKLDRGTRRARFGSDWAEAEILRGQPPAGLEAEGPCIFELPEATLVLPPGWSATVDDAGTVAANREERRPATSRAKRLHLARNDSLDPVTLQVLVGALRAACDEMGAVLIRSAHSPNITERHDCSTALFDPAGELVMQAEHIPVHLGSMPDAVGAVVEERHRPGDLWILNDPYRGGTHLPDVTLISPLFAGDGGEGDLVGFAASRAHHADIGGPTPGGMPADSTTLEEEGVVIPPTRATDDLLAELATRMRNPPQRLADLRAQRAANLVGARRMQELLDRYGLKRLRVGLAEILDYAERRTRAALECLPDGRYEAEDVLEDDARGTNITLRVAAVIEGDRLTLDFAGTDAQGPGNLNCPLSVTKSAVFFAVRVLTDPDAPPSAGAHRPVDVVAPEGCVLRARPPAAVAGGNVETSSRVADLVLEALGNATPTPAHGQGTMNNLTLAGDGFTYYETIGGGQGGCPHADGPSAIHVAMSNTLNTPVEAFETEFPFRVRELSVRRGSGGAGRHPGGDGTIRELEALAPARLNLITERRRHAPRGRAGGENGAPGRNLVNGEQVPSKTGHDLRPGDRVRIETPGGGGYGTAPE